MWSDPTGLFLPVFQEALTMIGVSGDISALSGVLLGVLLYLTITDGVLSAPTFNRMTGLIVNAIRSVPFIILLVAIIPFTRLLVDSPIGTTAATVLLTIAAIPFVARLIKTALRKVDRDLIEAARSMGAMTDQLVYKMLLPEAMLSILAGLTITFVSLVGYSVMAGIIGGGGLGDLNIRYDYQCYESGIMLTVVVVLTVFVQVVQLTGGWLVRHLNHR